MRDFFDERKVATKEEVALAMVIMLSVGLLAGWTIAMNIEYFADQRVKDCLNYARYE